MSIRVPSLFRTASRAQPPVIHLVAARLVHMSERKCHGSIGDLIDHKMEKNRRRVIWSVGGLISGNQRFLGQSKSEGIIRPVELRVYYSHSGETRPREVRTDDNPPDLLFVPEYHYSHTDMCPMNADSFCAI